MALSILLIIGKKFIIYLTYGKKDKLRRAFFFLEERRYVPPAKDGNYILILRKGENKMGEQNNDICNGK